MFRGLAQAALRGRTSSNNADGTIVGRYLDAAYMSHGFVRTAGVITSFDIPGAFSGTLAYSINTAGAIAGLYYAPNDLQEDLQALAGPSAGPNGGSLFIDGFSGGELPAKQSIREIRINQNPFSPERAPPSGPVCEERVR